MIPPKTTFTPSRVEQEHFPYCEAFEDLLLASQGLPMRPQLGDLGMLYHSRTQQFGRWHNTDSMAVTHAFAGMSWINRLEMEGLLTPGHPGGLGTILGMLWSGLSSLEEPSSLTANIPDRSRSSSADPETELDMYDRFLRSLWPPTGPIRSDDEDMPMNGKYLRQLYRESEARMQEHEKTTAQRPPAPPMAPGAPGGTKRIISTITTTEQSTSQDGTIQTKVLVQRRFADGRETTTETVHTQHAQSLDDEKKEADSAETKDNSKDTKKGWFWN